MLTKIRDLVTYISKGHDIIDNSSYQSNKKVLWSILRIWFLKSALITVKIIMKFFLVFLAFFAAASANNDGNMGYQVSKRGLWKSYMILYPFLINLITHNTILGIHHTQDECTLCHMSVNALGNYLMTEAEIAAVQEGKTLLFYNQPFSIFCQPEICT